jgi:HTH-type transcriptional regulator, cell division transcriptional repressor
MTTTPDTGTGWYSDTTATFGDRITGAREAVGLSQEELARRLGVRLRTIRAWEDDLAEPRANKLQMLAGLLNVSLRWILTGEGDGIPGPGEAEVPEEITALLIELRDVKSQLVRAADRVAVIERKLRSASGAAA